MISNNDKRKYLRILINLKEKNVNIYTQQELSNYLSVSQKKMNSFLNGKLYDFWLLIQFSSIIGIELEL